MKHSKPPLPGRPVDKAGTVLFSDTSDGLKHHRVNAEAVGANRSEMNQTISDFSNMPIIDQNFSRDGTSKRQTSLTPISQNVKGVFKNSMISHRKDELKMPAIP